MEDGIAVIDYDCLSSIGLDAALSWENLVKNRSGIGTIDRYNPNEETLQGVTAISYGGQVPTSFDELAGSSDRFKKWSEPSYHAVTTLSKRVFERIGFNIAQHDPQRIAFLGGTALTSQISRDTLAKTLKADSKFILNQCQNIPLSVAASEYGIKGPCFSVGSACSSSGHAIFLAFQFLKAGLIDCAFVVGYEFPLMPFSVGGLDWVNALYRRDTPEDRGYSDSTAASRPFSKDRRGFVLSEGAGAILISDSGYAQRMGWPIKGRIGGGYANSDADHITRASVSNISFCMSAAISAAGCNENDIDCVNAHGTSTPIGDAAELKALYEVFGPRLKEIPVVANKSQIGHSLGASSILALILALEGMHQGVALPTLNHVRDPSLPEAFIPPEAIEYKHKTTLLNSFGFGGTNISIVLERGEH